jgi:hypothetical protein
MAERVTEPVITVTIKLAILSLSENVGVGGGPAAMDNVNRENIHYLN